MNVRGLILSSGFFLCIAMGMVANMAVTAQLAWADVAQDSALVAPDIAVPRAVPGIAPQPGRAQHAAFMAALFTRLRAAPDEQDAERVAQAIEQLWLHSGSDTIDLLMDRAIKAVRARDYPLALRLLTSVTRAMPAYAEGWNQRSMVYFLMADYAAALGDIKHVLAIEPRHFKALQGLAVILNEYGAKKRALDIYRKVLQIYPMLSSARQAEKELVRQVEGQGI